VNWKAFRRKRFCPDYWCYFGICLKGLQRITSRLWTLMFGIPLCCLC